MIQRVFKTASFEQQQQQQLLISRKRADFKVAGTAGQDA